MTKSPSSSASQAQDFGTEAFAVLTDVRDALAAVLLSAPGGVHRASDVRDWLDLDAALGWSIYRAATAARPHDAGLYLPGEAAMSRCLAAAAAAGVPRDRIERARSAFVRFEALVERHAPSRAAFETMLGEITDEGLAAADLKQKRAAFRANSHLFGVQVGTVLNTHLHAPNAARTAVDTVSLKGSLGLCRLRRSVDVQLKLKSISTDPRALEQPTPDQTPGIRPLLRNPQTEAERHGLLSAFCTQPLPTIEPAREDGSVTLRVRTSDVGVGGSASFVIGYIDRELLPPAGCSQPQTYSFHTWMPTSVWHQDLAFHQSLGHRACPSVTWYRSRQGAAGQHVYPEDARMGVMESAIELGTGLHALDTPEVPGYREMLGLACERMGWKPDEFRCYRIRIEYPIMYAHAVVRFDPPR